MEKRNWKLILLEAIAKRNRIASIVTIALMIVIGLFISDMKEYRKVVQITDPAMFQDGMETNVGNAFIYGELKAVDPVSYPEIDGQYMYMKKVREQYREDISAFYVQGRGFMSSSSTWNEVDSEEKECRELSFCGVTFDRERIDLTIPDVEYIETIYTSENVRYKYYGVKSQNKGTIYAVLKDNTMVDAVFHKDMDIKKTVELYESNKVKLCVVFWIVWILIMVVIVALLPDNQWLEERRKQEIAERRSL